MTIPSQYLGTSYTGNLLCTAIKQKYLAVQIMGNDSFLEAVDDTAQIRTLPLKRFKKSVLEKRA